MSIYAPKLEIANAIRVRVPNAMEEMEPGDEFNPFLLWYQTTRTRITKMYLVLIHKSGLFQGTPKC